MVEMLRYNSGKPRLSFFPSSFWDVLMFHRKDDLNEDMIFDIAKVLDFGAAKYTKDNWRTSGSWCKCADSGLRHLLAYIQGEVYDQESGLPHLAHFGCNLVFLIEFQRSGSGVDDRYRRPGNQRTTPWVCEGDNPEEDLLQLYTRWLESENDEYIEAALVILNDFYGEVDDSSDPLLHQV